ncbi:MAG: hypothetical protein AB1432_15705 [Bacteroidota bacterium]
MIFTLNKPKSKPRKACPKCGGKSIAKIRCGLIGPNKISGKKYDEEKVFLLVVASSWMMKVIYLDIIVTILNISSK